MQNICTMLILIIDDIYSQALKIEGFLHKNMPSVEAHICTYGHEALEYMETRIPNLIITDLHLPEMDGFEILKMLKQRGNSIPIIVSSVMPYEHYIPLLKSLNVVGLCNKEGLNIMHCIQAIIRDQDGFNPTFR